MHDIDRMLERLAAQPTLLSELMEEAILNGIDARRNVQNDHAKVGTACAGALFLGVAGSLLPFNEAPTGMNGRLFAPPPLAPSTLLDTRT